MNNLKLSRVCANARKIFLMIIFMQFLYITILTKFNFVNFIVWLILFLIGYVFLIFISFDLSRITLMKFKSNYFKWLLLITAVSTLFFSRLEYIVNTIDFGLADTRLNEELGRGGLYSILNVMFYPLAMLSVFYEKSKLENIFFWILTLIVCMVDVFFLGTRNSVFFVLFFMIIYDGLIDFKFSFKNLLILALITCFAIYLFEYTTRVRSGFDGLPSLYWLEKSLYSEAMSMSEMNEDLYFFMDANFWYALPFFYLISYVSHPIPELGHFLNEYSDWFFPSLAHLRLYFSNITFQDSSELINLLEILRVRPGYYQTLYASLIVDFGIAVFLLIPSYLLMRYLRNFYLFQIYLLPVMCLSTIENYFFTGLTPVRALLFLLLGMVFIRRVH